MQRSDRITQKTSFDDSKAFLTHERSEKKSWMAWTVELYCPESDWVGEYTDGQLCTAIAMWTTAVTVVVPLALFLFAAIADCCCCRCNADKTDGEDFSSKFISIGNHIDVSYRDVENSLRQTLACLQPKEETRAVATNLLCSRLTVPESLATSDDELSLKVALRYNSHQGEWPVDYEALNNWLQNLQLETIATIGSQLLLQDRIYLDIVRQLSFEARKAVV
jgi:hypothetical protein